MKISVIFGTRPEAIKLAPLILALKEHPCFECHVCVTAQHREMLDQVLKVFEIEPDTDLNLMKPNQTLAGLTSRAVTGLDAYLAEEKPDMVIVQGDTTTVFSGALAAFYHHIPVAHVEAGLRTGNMLSPWPEEANRVLTSRLTALHFAPTSLSEKNLLDEGISPDAISVTGNTVIDALFLALEKIKQDPPSISDLPDFLQPTSLRAVDSTEPEADLSPSCSAIRAGSSPQSSDQDKPKLVLITGHRRENFGGGFEDICNAIAELASNFPDVHFVYPMHLNPNVREPVMRILREKAEDGSQRTEDGSQMTEDRDFDLSKTENLKPKTSSGNIHLIEPLQYLPFVAMMNRAHIILTDSGGVQEEAPSLGKPVLVMRDTTERPEAVDAGTVKLVGTDRRAIVDEVSKLLEDSVAYESMSHAHNPYGDGKAAGRHLQALEKYFQDRE